MSQSVIREFSQPSNQYLTLIHSLGYECHRYYNLCVIDECSIIFCSGRLLHVLDTETRQVSTRLSERGVSLGFVTKNPVQPHIAVGEKCLSPLIIIYNIPTFEIVQKLKDGTTKEYVFLQYSPDGLTLCAQGGAPDSALTLWDWKAGTIVAKATSPGTLRVQFSTFKHNYIVSCGDEGLSFWRLTKTFTGKKLLHQQGHFNILDECQVLAVYIMPDGQVVSGCSWGNILVWSSVEGRVIAEACQRDRKPCHDGPIVHFAYNQLIDELYTVAMDGWIKMWHYGRFKSDPFSDDLMVVIKPVFEIQVSDSRGPSVLSYFLKRNNHPNDTVWFAQDQQGGVWQVDVRVSATVCPPERLYTCHAGPVMAVVACPRHPYCATIGANGLLLIHHLVSSQLVAWKKFSVGGTALLWINMQIVSGEEIIVGFEDGTVKVLLFLPPDSTSIDVFQESKPHKAAVTAICVDEASGVVVTGSTDKTVFVYWLQSGGHLKAAGFLELPGPICYFSWNPCQARKLLICCPSSLNEVVIPEEIATGISFKIKTPITSIFHIQSGNKQVVNLLYAAYYNDNNICLADNDALYNYIWDTKNVVDEKILDQSIRTVYFLSKGHFWFLGLANGTLRTVRKDNHGWLSQNGEEDMTLHELECGGITDICVTADLKYLVHCGMDGNVFVYTLEEQTILPQVSGEVPLLEDTPPPHKEEILTIESGVSLEEAKKEAVLREKMAVSMMKKARIQKQLASLRLRYSKILARNAMLPESQRLPKSEFRLDKRLQFHIRDIINLEMKEIRKVLNFNVQKSKLRLLKMKSYFIDCLAAFHIEISSIRGKKSVTTFVHRKLESDFEEGEENIKNLMEKTSERMRVSTSEILTKPVSELPSGSTLEVDTEEPHLRSVQDIYFKLNIKTKRALEKHKSMRIKKEERKKVWQAFMATQPNQERNLTTDVAAIDHALRTIGDYKLKQADNFKLPDQSKNTSLFKLNQLIETKREIFKMKENFNSKVYTLRDEKVELVQRMSYLEDNLLQLHEELPEQSRVQPPPLPLFNAAKEFPERQYQEYPGKVPSIKSPLPKIFDEELFVLCGHKTPISSVDCIEKQEDTMWESDLKTLRMVRQLFKQEQIIEEMDLLVQRFDQQVEELSSERLQLSFDIKYLECFVSVLHQELLVVHSYDAQESAILDRVNNSLAEKHTKHLKTNVLQHKIDVRTAELSLLEEKLVAIEKTFTELAASSRVVKHLTRMFRKKFRPQLPHSEDEEEEVSDVESSSEETSEDSDSSTDIRVGKPSPRREHTKCPSDCDQNIHNEVLLLREKRYQTEAKITAEKQTIDQITRERERNFKFLKLIEPVLRMNQDQLDKLQKEKQGKLNEIEVLVVLNCSQISGRELVMSLEELDKLKGRVSELQRQTDSQLAKLKKIQRYQQRLIEECSEIEVKNSQLKKDIDKAMVCKFGQQVDVEILEEKILEDMIKKTRQSLKEEELHKQYEGKIKNLKEDLLDKTEILADLMRDNTHKLQMLSSMEEEKEKLTALASRVAKAASEPNDREIEYTQDVRKLTRILQNQILQKETIIHEIKVLSLKGRPLPPILPSIVEETTKSTTIQSQSRDSDDLASNECQTTREEQDDTKELDDTEQSQEGKGESNEDPQEAGEQESEGSESNQEEPIEKVLE